MPRSLAPILFFSGMVLVQWPAHASPGRCGLAASGLESETRRIAVQEEACVGPLCSASGAHLQYQALFWASCFKGT